MPESLGQKEDLNPWTTFVVSALIGRFMGSPWPFGRLYISDEEIIVRTAFRERACHKSQITAISLERLGPNSQLLFEDTEGKMADVAVALAMRVKGVVGELKRRGYPVVDRRPRIFPLPQGVVPWRDPDDDIDRRPPGQ
ncbi:MAG TPA: hypothetical protein VMA72_24305 [Streptosporangiaceae bacterium]|nr:hypothetical protein [Streptosporangiaceae bacterium]